MGKHRVAPIVVGLGLLLCVAGAHAEQLGGAGESCQRRADCESGLRCIDNECVAQEREGGCSADGDCGAGASCQDGQCRNAPESAADEPKAGTSEESPAAAEEREDGADVPWEDFSLEGTHMFAGLSVGPSVTGWWQFRAKQFDVMGGLFFGIRAGALFDRAEIALELAPVTWVPRFDGDPNLSFLVSVGGYPEIGEGVYWPLRFGLGLSAVDTPIEPVLMQGRLDLLGVAFQYGHLIFELSLPSARFHTEFDQLGIWGWLANLSVSYVLL